MPPVPALVPRTPAENEPGLVGVTAPSTPLAKPSVETVVPRTPGWVPVAAACTPANPAPAGSLLRAVKAGAASPALPSKGRARPAGSCQPRVEPFQVSAWPAAVGAGA